MSVKKHLSLTTTLTSFHAFPPAIPDEKVKEKLFDDITLVLGAVLVGCKSLQAAIPSAR